jgi:hypothetical protein
MSIIPFQTHRKTLNGYDEIYRTLPKQVAIPTDLLNWARQLIKEGIRAGVSEYDIFTAIRVKGIEEYYSHQQIEQLLARLILESKEQGK